MSINEALKDAGDNYLTIGGVSWNKVKQREFMQSQPVANNEAQKTHLTFSCGDAMAANAKAPAYLISNILEQDSHGLLVGASMAFKTFAAIRLAHAVCTGKSFFGNSVQRQGKVIYVCGEGKGALSRRFKAITSALGGFNENLRVLNENLLIDAPAAMAALEIAIAEINPVLVIFDTFSSLIGETQENSNSDVANCLRLIKQACTAQGGEASTIVVHHSGKDKSNGTRGASAFQGNTDFLFTMERVENSMLTVLHCEKQKDGQEFCDITMEAKQVDIGITGEDGKPVNSLAIVETDKKAEKKNAQLTQKQQCLENAFSKVMRENPQEIPPELKTLHHFDKGAKAVLIDEVKKHFFKTVTVDSKGDIQAAKRSAFTRTVAYFYKKNKMVHSGELMWRF